MKLSSQKNLNKNSLVSSFSFPVKCLVRRLLLELQSLYQKTLECSQKHQQNCCCVLHLLYNSFESISVQITRVTSLLYCGVSFLVVGGFVFKSSWERNGVHPSLCKCWCLVHRVDCECHPVAVFGA